LKVPALEDHRDTLPARGGLESIARHSSRLENVAIVRSGRA
jgi:hypothetical protein